MCTADEDLVYCEASTFDCSCFETTSSYATKEKKIPFNSYGKNDNKKPTI
jgi:hypothetical protein